MDADWSVELGADDPVLEVPWAAPDGTRRYYDLRRQPELLLYIEEASREPALGEFLAAINARSVLQSAKCDVWFSREITEEEQVYGGSCKLGSYVDLIFAAEGPQSDFCAHEDFCRRLTALLKKAPEIAASAEFIIRRCYFHCDQEDTRAGLYFTYYCFGYGDDEPSARKFWTIALKLVENAVLQLSAAASPACQRAPDASSVEYKQGSVAQV